MAFALAVILSLVGSVYMYAGKRNAKLIMMVDGVIMCCIPYFITNTAFLLITSLVLCVVPFVIRES